MASPPSLFGHFLSLFANPARRKAKQTRWIVKQEAEIAEQTRRGVEQAKRITKQTPKMIDQTAGRGVHRGLTPNQIIDNITALVKRVGFYENCLALAPTMMLRWHGMKILKNVVLYALGVVVSIGLISGCGGGGGNDGNFADGGVTALCADGTRSPMLSTREKAEAFCATHGGVAPTPTRAPQ